MQFQDSTKQDYQILIMSIFIIRPLRMITSALCQLQPKFLTFPTSSWGLYGLYWEQRV